MYTRVSYIHMYIHTYMFNAYITFINTYTNTSYKSGSHEALCVNLSVIGGVGQMTSFAFLFFNYI